MHVCVRVHQTTTKYQGFPPLSRPGAWAYPDMLEVGRMPSLIEDRTHFGAWVITSSPLILGYDLNDEASTGRVWEIIANPEALAISQTWAGHPGRLVKSWQPTTASDGSGREALPDGLGDGMWGTALWAERCNPADPAEGGFSYDPPTQVGPDCVPAG
jgi:hypothetical protein